MNKHLREAIVEAACRRRPRDKWDAADLAAYVKNSVEAL